MNEFELRMSAYSFALEHAQEYDTTEKIINEASKILEFLAAKTLNDFRLKDFD